MKLSHPLIHEHARVKVKAKLTYEYFTSNFSCTMLYLLSDCKMLYSIHKITYTLHKPVNVDASEYIYIYACPFYKF